MNEVHRHQCEVRWCLQKGFAWFESFAEKVKKERGAEAARALWQDVKAQYALGNRGEPGDWRNEKAKDA